VAAGAEIEGRGRRRFETGDRGVQRRQCSGASGRTRWSQPFAERSKKRRTGTGAGALWLAREFPDARVTGLDISEAMIERAKAKVSDELSGRVESWSATPSGCRSRTAPWSWSLRSACRFLRRGGARARPRGYVVVVSSLGLKTPFHTPERTLREGFRRRGIETVATGAEGPGTFFLGRRSA
jgi:hypothetical protein